MVLKDGIKKGGNTYLRAAQGPYRLNTFTDYNENKWLTNIHLPTVGTLPQQKGISLERRESESEIWVMNIRRGRAQQQMKVQVLLF